MHRDLKPLLTDIDILLAEEYEVLRELGVAELSESERQRIPYLIFSSKLRPAKNATLAAVCQCFYLFRRFHYLENMNRSQNILLGDYFSSRFSNYLIKMNDSRLDKKFSEFLKQDAIMAASGRTEFPVSEYEDFCLELCDMEDSQ